MPVRLDGASPGSSGKVVFLDQDMGRVTNCRCNTIGAAPEARPLHGAADATPLCSRGRGAGSHRARVLTPVMMCQRGCGGAPVITQCPGLQRPGGQVMTVNIVLMGMLQQEPSVPGSLRRPGLDENAMCAWAGLGPCAQVTGEDTQAVGVRAEPGFGPAAW